MFWSSAPGPRGSAAALSAARSGARVILCDEGFALGGRLLAERREIDGEDAGAWLTRTCAELESLPELRIMRRTTVFGVYDGGTYGAVERVSDHLAVPPAHHAAPADVAHRRQTHNSCRRARSSSLSCSAATIGPA